MSYKEHALKYIRGLLRKSSDLDSKDKKWEVLCTLIPLPLINTNHKKVNFIFFPILLYLDSTTAVCDFPLLSSEDDNNDHWRIGD